MVKEELAYFVRKLSSVHDRGKPPTGDTLDSWLEILSFIPGQDIDLIYNKMKLIDWPKGNFPAKVIEIWRSIKQENNKDFLIDIIERNSRDHGFDYLESFYDLRYPIKTKGVNMGPAIKWLQSQGFRVDMYRLNEPCLDRKQLLRDLENKFNPVYDDKVPF